MGIVDFFSKKETLEEKKLKEKIMEAKMEKQQLAKKPVKKTSSKKTTTVKQKSEPKKIEEKKEQTISPKIPPQPQTLVFFTQEIKRIYHKNQWYYCLEDIVGLTGKLKLDEYLNNLKGQENYQEKKQEFIVDIPIKIDSQVKILEFINKKGIINWLIPKLRDDERYFPGPFPYWLNQVDNESPKTN